MTNIIRDVREDAERGRVYLPEEDLIRFGLSPEGILPGGDGLTELLKFEGRRARALYDESRPLVRMVGPRFQSSLWALIEIYSRLLHKIERGGYAVMDQRVALSPVAKLGIVGRAALRLY